jgi:AraC-like DNA-binding protein
MPGTEILLRGAVIGMSILVAIHMVLAGKRHSTMIAGAMFAIGIAVYTYLSSPLGRPWTPSQLPLIFFSTFNPGFFWLFARAVIDDKLELTLLNIAAVLFIPLLFIFTFVTPEPLKSWIAMIQQAAAIIMFVAIAYMSLKDIGSDLVNKRRWFRFAIAFLIPATGLAVAVAEIYQLSTPLPQWLYSVQAVALCLLTMLMALWTLRIDDSILQPSSRSDKTEQERHTSGQVADQAEIARLGELVASGVLLEENMTVGRLARRLLVPEHRMRRIINREMGYRNFAEFLNNHRIEIAKSRLTKPSRPREQIDQIAYSLGYSSLAPFNKAFRERTGMSPSEYRDGLKRRTDRI